MRTLKQYMKSLAEKVEGHLNWSSSFEVWVHHNPVEVPDDIEPEPNYIHVVAHVAKRRYVSSQFDFISMQQRRTDEGGNEVDTFKCVPHIYEQDPEDPDLSDPLGENDPIRRELEEKVWAFLKDEPAVEVIRQTFEERLTIVGWGQVRYMRKKPKVFTTAFTGNQKVDFTQYTFRIVGEGNKFTITKIR